MDRITKLNAYAHKLRASAHAGTMSWPEAFHLLHDHAHELISRKEPDMKYLTPTGELDNVAIKAKAAMLAKRWRSLDIPSFPAVTSDEWYEFALREVVQQAKHNQRLWELLQDA
jgi:hypothetical protein